MSKGLVGLWVNRVTLVKCVEMGGVFLDESKNIKKICQTLKMRLEKTMKLISKGNIKKYCKEQGKRTSTEFITGVENKVKEILDNAIKKAYNFKTLKPSELL